MAELAHVIEYLSVDVVLIGLIFSLFLALSCSIWRCRSSSVCEGLSEGFKGVRRFVRRQNSRVYTVVFVVVASQIGTILVRLSDEVLDSQKAINSRCFLYVPAFGDICRLESWIGEEERWQEEDLLKLEVLKDTFKRSDFTPEIMNLLERHLPHPEGSCFESNDKEDCAKGFFQHAHAVVMGERGYEDQREELRHEKYTVKLLSSVFVGSWLLLGATVFGPLFFAGRKLLSCHRNKARLVQLFHAVVFIFLVWTAEGFTLRLWTEQSIRYNRRLVHAYIAIASFGDPAMDIPNIEFRK